MSDGREMREIMSLIEAVNNIQEIDMNFDSLESRLMRVTADVARTWESEAGAGYKERPSGPDTGKFIARSYSMIEPEYNIDIPQGQFDRRYIAFLKIGSDIDLSTRRDIISDFEETISVYTDGQIDVTDSHSFMTSDGVRVFYGKVSGTSWGGAGFYVSR